MTTKQLFIICSTAVIIVAIWVGVNYFKTSQNIKLQELDIKKEELIRGAEIEKSKIQAEIKKEVEQEKSERAWMHRIPGLRTKKDDE